MKNKKHPLVSIIITTQNRKELLARAITSAINQTYEKIEIIIVNDNSSDDTESIILKYMKKDSRIKYLKNKEKLGANVSRNKGIEISRGKFIAGLDDDDQFLPNRIKILLENYNDKYAFVTSNYTKINDDGYKMTTNKPSTVHFKDMLANNMIGNQGLIKKNRLIKVGLYDEKLTACQDYDLWMRLMLKFGKVKVIKESTQVVYVDNSINRISTNSKNKFRGYFNFYKKYKKFMNKENKLSHLIRIYEIRSVSKGVNYLAIHLLLKKIDYLRPSSLSVYGTGEFMNLLLPHLKKRNITINYFIDSYSNKEKIFGIKIIKPEDISKINEKVYLIASVSYYKEIYKTIKNFMNNQKIKIISL